MESQDIQAIIPYLYAFLGWVLTVLVPGLWAIYEKKKRVTVEDGVKILVDSIQKHSQKTGDRTIKDDVASQNNKPLNEIVKKFKDKVP